MKLAKQKLLSLAFIMLLTFTALCGCESGDTAGNKSLYDFAEDSIFYEEMKYLYQYAEEYNIPLPKFSERAEIANILTQSNYDNKWENMIYVDRDTAFFKEDSYVGTGEVTDYMYWGELNKDDRPDGIGILYQYYYDFDYSNPQLLVMYMGEFEDGFYSGYGVEFEIPDIDGDYPMKVARVMTKENIHIFNDPIYEGYFEEGQRSGIGTEIIWNYGAYNYDTGENLMDTEQTDFVLFIGEFVKDELKGEIELYNYKGVLEYEGEYKNGYFNGEGKYYYVDSPGTLMYEGEFSGGNFFGEGTLYDKEGNIVKKGEFKNVSPAEYLMSQYPEALVSSSNEEEEAEEFDSKEANNDLTEANITELVNSQIIERIMGRGTCISAEIISVTSDDAHKVYECVTEFSYKDCLVRANLVLDYQGQLVSASIEDRFNGSFNQELYDSFCQVIGYVAAYYQEGMWEEICTVLPIESGSNGGLKEMISELYNAYYTFDYDLVDERRLQFMITFPLG